MCEDNPVVKQLINIDAIAKGIYDANTIIQVLLFYKNFVMELEREIQAIKALRMEMEKYKVDFSLTVEDEATKKIQEVISGIDKMFK